MASLWHYQHAGLETGPITSLDLKAAAVSGRLLRTDMLRRQDMSDWVQAQSVKGLFPPVELTVDEPVAGAAAEPPPLPANSEPPPLPASSGPPPLPATNDALAEVGTKVRTAFVNVKGMLGGALEAVQSSIKTPASSSPPPLPVNHTEAKQQVNPSRLPEGVGPSDVIVECLVAYRGGHPVKTNDGDGTLLLTPNAFYFVGPQPESDIAIEHGKIVDVLTPSPGSFSQEMIERATTTKTLANVGRQATQIAGMLIGDLGGRAVRAIGSTAAGAASEQASLGPPPKNRLTIVLVDGGARHKMTFDVMAPTKEGMEAKAAECWRKVATVRSKFYQPTAASNSASTVNVAADARPAGASKSSDNGSSLYVMKAGVVSGPHHKDEVRAMIAAGKLGPADAIRVEAWLPVGTIQCLDMNPAAIASNGREGTQGSNPPPAAPRPDGKGRSPAISAAAAGIGGAVIGAVAASLLSPGPSHAAAPTAGSRRLKSARTLDLNNDGTPDAVGLDRNHDGHIDTVGIDTDHDGRIDAVGIDVNEDGVADAVGMDRDGDGQLDTYGFDTDGDGDVDVVGYDQDEDGEIDDYETE